MCVNTRHFCIYIYIYYIYIYTYVCVYIYMYKLLTSTYIIYPIFIYHIPYIRYQIGQPFICDDIFQITGDDMTLTPFGRSLATKGLVKLFKLRVNYVHGGTVHQREKYQSYNADGYLFGV